MKANNRLEMNKATHIIGIDPGKGGGIGRVISVDKNIWSAYKCPKTIDEMVEIIKTFKKFAVRPICYLESVHAFPTDGRSSAFKFGENFGVWKGILSSFDIETKLVTPQKWQKHFGELPKVKKDRKAKLKQIATDKTKIKATLNTADALCITVYGYETRI